MNFLIFFIFCSNWKKEKKRFSKCSNSGHASSSNQVSLWYEANTWAKQWTEQRTSTASNGAVVLFKWEFCWQPSRLPSLQISVTCVASHEVFSSVCVFSSTDAARRAEHNLFQQWLQTRPQRLQTPKLRWLRLQPLGSFTFHRSTHLTPAGGESNLPLYCDKASPSRSGCANYIFLYHGGVSRRNTFIDGPRSFSRRNNNDLGLGQQPHS